MKHWLPIFLLSLVPLAGAQPAAPGRAYPPAMEPETVVLKMRAVADAQLARAETIPAQADLGTAVWRRGLLALAGLTGDARYRTAAEALPAAAGWPAAEGLAPELRRAVEACATAESLKAIAPGKRLPSAEAKELNRLAGGLACEADDPAVAGLAVCAKAYGVNEAIQMMWLDSSRVPAIRGWLKLAGAADAPGGLGGGAEARLRAGAFLLAGAEIHRLALALQQPMPFVTTEEYQRDLKEQRQRLADAPAPTVESSKAAMRRACEAQLANLFQGKGGDAQDAPRSWYRGALTSGIVAAWKTTGDPYYLEVARTISEENDWQPGPNYLKDGNDLAIAHAYLEIYEAERKPEQLAPTRKAMDELIAAYNPEHIEWSWCDALFMSPPSWARMAAVTGDRQYLDHMNKMWWETTDLLYDREDHLYYRDAVFAPYADGYQIRERNGRKIFWGRGNGWVVGGLCRVLEYMPADYPERPRYEQLLREMAQALLATQGEDGLWRASLLDPESYPMGETSSSTFFCYGLAWGINHGVLDRAQYLSAARKAWHALTACTEPDSGRLGYVQLPADSPRSPVFRRSNVEYATGAFLLAGGEMLKLID